MSTLSRLSDIYTEVLSNRMGHDVCVDESAIHFQPAEGLNAVVNLHDGDPEYLCIRAFFNAPLCASRESRPRLTPMLRRWSFTTRCEQTDARRAP